jgi:ribonuclease Y
MTEFLPVSPAPVFLAELSTGLWIGLILAAGMLGLGAGILVVTTLSSRSLRRARAEGDLILQTARAEGEAKAKELELDGEKRATERRAQIDREMASALAEVKESQARAARREETLDKKLEAITQRETRIDQRESRIKTLETEAETIRDAQERLREELKQRLSAVSGMTPDQAKEAFLIEVREESAHEGQALSQKIIEDAERAAMDRAREITLLAIQRYAAENVSESTVRSIKIPSDDLKGRIIGREGRNIRALEQATGVELIVDDTPGAIILSSFDPYRREVARQSIERLIADGRIHPARIEEVVEKVRSELEDAVRRDGESAAFELGLHDVHPELLRLMGRLKFRTSYGQNVLNHSKEVAFLAGVMARELGLDAQVSVRAAFLHDVGKAVDRDMEGTHLEIGLDLLRKHGERPPVIDAVAAHHMDIDWPSLEAMIVQAADAISAARPGARRDILESYVKRLAKLEDIASSFKGVARSFALQAGREIRIMVQSEQVSDEDAVWLSKDIARRIENELEYPGQIKVTVIRETRAVEIAR